MRTITRILSLCCLIIAFSVGFTPAWADDVTVNTCDFATLTAAVGTAELNGGGTITFNCSGTIIFGSQFIINTNVTINANGNTVIFDESGNDNRFFFVSGGASLELNDLTLQNGNGDFGGAIYNAGGTLTTNNNTFTGNSAGIYGGAIYNTGGTLTTNNSTFTNNSANDGGAIVNNFTGIATINNSMFTNNHAGEFGGAIVNLFIMTISNSTFTDNSPLDQGGAIYNVGSDNTLTINTSTFTNNSANDGGAIYNAFGGTVTTNNSTFTVNTANYAGGAIYNSASSTLTTNNSTFTGNSTDDGGAIFILAGGTATIINTTFTDNLAYLVGGAIFNAGDVSISTSIFTNNIAMENGGAVANFDTATSQDTHYEGNETNNTCLGATIADNGGNTKVNSAGCPGSAPIALSVSALTCNNDSAVFEILAGDSDFSITGTGAGLPINPASIGLYGLVGPDTWTNIIITELKGDRQSVNIGGISCPEAVIIPPTIPTTSSVTVLGCALDSTDGVEVAGAPDDTYCRVLMKNGGVVSYSGAIPADLIGLGVVLAVDVYRLQGGATVNTFPDYARVCLAGTGRLFYMDGRNAPRFSIEMPTEQVDGLTCGWIPAPGTLILTN